MTSLLASGQVYLWKSIYKSKLYFEDKLLKSIFLVPETSLGIVMYHEDVINVKGFRVTGSL